MKLNTDNYETIKILLNNMDIREDRIIATIDNKDIVVVPSNKYPLKNKNDIHVFTSQNTEKLQDIIIQKIYDNIDFKIGKCYNNMKNLQKELIEVNITNFKIYVGWVFIDYKTYPVHHCFMVYNDKYVLDPSMQLNTIMFREEIINNPQLSDDIIKMREELVKITKKINKLSFSKKSTFGKILDKEMIYVVSECSIRDGENIFKELISTYPDHPIYQRKGMNAHGLSLTQQMIEGGN